MDKTIPLDVSWIRTEAQYAAAKLCAQALYGYLQAMHRHEGNLSEYRRALEKACEAFSMASLISKKLEEVPEATANPLAATPVAFVDHTSVVEQFKENISALTTEKDLQLWYTNHKVKIFGLPGKYRDRIFDIMRDRTLEIRKSNP